MGTTPPPKVSDLVFEALPLQLHTVQTPEQLRKEKCQPKGPRPTMVAGCSLESLLPCFRGWGWGGEAETKLVSAWGLAGEAKSWGGNGFRKIQK